MLMEMHKLAFHSTARSFSPLSSNLFYSRPRSTVRNACRASSLPSQDQAVKGPGILCDPCGGKGWVVCDFCDGQKTNVQSRNKRMYRRCPSCRAIGLLICQKCKVFKCLTFPDEKDSAR